MQPTSYPFGLLRPGNKEGFERGHTRLGKQGVGRAFADGCAAVHEGYAGAEPLGLDHVVRGIDDRHAVGVESAEVRDDLLPGMYIDAHCRLVEEEDTGAMEQGNEEVELALHAAREVFDAFVQVGAEVEAVRIRVDAFAERAGGEAVHATEEVKVLRGGQLGIEGNVLRYDADQRTDAGTVVTYIEAAEMHRATVERQEAGEDRERRRLACAIGAE